MFDQRLAAVLREILDDEAQAWLERIGNNGASALNDEVAWGAHKRRMMDQLVPIFEGLVTQGVADARTRLGNAGISIDWNLVNENAAQWARQHAGELIEDITQTTRSRLGEQVAQWVEAQETLADLTERIGAISQDGAMIFTPQRAELIATTEATNVYAEANAKAWEAAGYAPAAFHPAAHPRCRCYIQPRRLPNGNRVMVWYTARDELVCTKPIKTPWGEVNGCRELHTVIVSSGPYLGRRMSEVENG